MVAVIGTVGAVRILRTQKDLMMPAISEDRDGRNDRLDLMTDERTNGGIVSMFILPSPAWPMHMSGM
jgi:hypothetical protein